MRPLVCAGGFNVPAKAGKFDILGFTAAVNDPSLDSELAIIDDVTLDWKSAGVGRIIPDIDSPTEVKDILVHKKGDGSAYDASLEWFPPEPIKIRHGLSICFSNIKQGSLCVYTR